MRQMPNSTGEYSLYRASWAFLSPFLQSAMSASIPKFYGIVLFLVRVYGHFHFNIFGVSFMVVSGIEPEEIGLVVQDLEP